MALEDTIRNIPPVTRFFTVLTVLVCFGHALHLIEISTFGWNWYFLQYRFGIVAAAYHRGLGAFLMSVLLLLAQSYRFFLYFFYPSGLLKGKEVSAVSAVLDIYFFYVFASTLEGRQGKFRGNFPDCLWCVLICGTTIVLSTLGLTYFTEHFAIPHQLLLSCVTYMWSRSEKNTKYHYFGIPIKAYYVPLFGLFVALLANDHYASAWDNLIGVFSGYLYLCIQSNTLPVYNLFPHAYESSSEKAGRRVGFTNTPKQLTDFFPDAIFDKGYLKAPIWLYNFLDYPKDNSKRSTAFRDPKMMKDEQDLVSALWMGGSRGNFKGKGQRLGAD